MKDQTCCIVGFGYQASDPGELSHENASTPLPELYPEHNQLLQVFPNTLAAN